MPRADSPAMPPLPAGKLAIAELSQCPMLLEALRSAAEVVGMREGRCSLLPAGSGDRTGDSLTGLLAVLTCCYANGILGSWQVREFMEDHPFLRELTGGVEPEVQELRRFRREHLSLLHAGLTRLLADVQPAPGPTPAGPEQHPVDHNLAAAVNPQTWLAHEAKSRIRRALLMDTIALDE